MWGVGESNMYLRKLFLHPIFEPRPFREFEWWRMRTAQKWGAKISPKRHFPPFGHLNHLKSTFVLPNFDFYALFGQLEPIFKKTQLFRGISMREVKCTLVAPLRKPTT